MVSNQNVNKENMLTHRISNMQEDPNNLETWIYKKEGGNKPLDHHHFSESAFRREC